MKPKTLLIMAAGIVAGMMLDEIYGREFIK